MRSKPGVEAFAAIAILLIAVPHTVMADSFTVTHAFGLRPESGILPDTAVVNAEGKIFVQTTWGGRKDKTQAGCHDPAGRSTNACGTITSLTATGIARDVWTFYALSVGEPSQLAILGSKVFGTASNVGADGKSSGLGIVFSVKTSGKNFKVLHAFVADFGAYPDGRLAVDGSGTAFGYTTSTSTNDNKGLLYSVSAHGKYKQLYQFNTTLDDYGVSILLNSAGTVFGTDFQGDPENKCGSAFSFQPKSAVFTTLFSFADGTHGCNPYLAGIDAGGNLFGYTMGDRDRNPGGTLFRLTPGTGGYTYSLLYTFRKSDGYQPTGLTLMPDGSLVGVTTYTATSGTGANGSGALFKYANGTSTILHSFTDPAGGTEPYGSPALTPSGQLVGTTIRGGDLNCTQTAAPPGCGVLYTYTP